MKNIEEGISFLWLGFAKWILKSCEEKGISKVYFFTREGEFFKKVFDCVLKSGGASSIKAEILEVSRLSTFSASIYDLNLEELKRMWSMYEHQSIHALLASLGLDLSIVEDVVRDYELDEWEVFEKPWMDSRVKALIGDQRTKKRLEAVFKKRREMFRKYCFEKGIDEKEKAPVAIVDIGWRGSIQDNLAQIFPDIFFEGYYLCLAPFLNQQPENTSKQGFLNSCDHEVVLRYPAPIEMLCNSDSGSVIGYEQNGSQISAVREADLKENKVYDSFTRNWQEMMLRLVDAKCQRQEDMEIEVCRERGSKALKKFLLFPPKAAADAFFSLYHNETFGNGCYVDKSQGIDKWLFINALYDRKKRIELKEQLWKTTWAQGYLKHCGMMVLLWLYNFMLSVWRRRK